jgi:MHS family metabolite:H+ symporter-like MFS transporter
LAAKSVVHHHHDDGDLYHPDWRITHLRADWHLCPGSARHITYYPGLGAGAEISGAGTMLAEYAPKGKRGIISSLVAMGTNCGTLSATAIWALMFFVLDREELVAWGWRIPFLASVVVMIFAIWLRMNLKESPVFEKVNDEDNAAPVPEQETTLGAMFKSKSFWLATGLRFGQAGNSGLIQTFLAGYLVQTLLFNKSIPTDALMISSILGFITIPLLGWLSDKIGRRLPYIVLNISAIILAYPMLSIIVDKTYTGCDHALHHRYPQLRRTGTVRAGKHHHGGNVRLA